jgi:peroxiredoxin
MVGNLGFAEKDIFAPGKVQIIGLSTDTVEKQKRFVEEQKLTVRIALCSVGFFFLRE